MIAPRRKRSNAFHLETDEETFDTLEIPSQ